MSNRQYKQLPASRLGSLGLYQDCMHCAGETLHLWHSLNLFRQPMPASCKDAKVCPREFRLVGNTVEMVSGGRCTCPIDSTRMLVCSDCHHVAPIPSELARRAKRR